MSSRDRRDPRLSRSRPKVRKAEDLLGTLVGGRYRVARLIGEGGMGTVYEATAEGSSQQVAVKVLRADQIAKRDAVSRFEREGKVLASIQHPSVCRIFELGRLDDGSPFMVMERLVGETLAARIEREGRMAPGELVAIVMDALGALDAAHRQNVVHRDFKPENIFIGRRHDGGRSVKVLDFGISKDTGLEDAQGGLTRTGMVMGTPYYMAPEQAMGERQLDMRVDVWAAGIVLYEGLTGARPFVAKNYNALLVQILTVNPKAVDSLVGDVPAPLVQVIKRALEKKREQRFQSARELALALRPFRGEDVLLDSVTQMAKPPREIPVLIDLGPSKAPITSWGPPAVTAKAGAGAPAAPTHGAPPVAPVPTVSPAAPATPSSAGSRRATLGGTIRLSAEARRAVEPAQAAAQEPRPSSDPVATQPKTVQAGTFSSPGGLLVGQSAGGRVPRPADGDSRRPTSAPSSQQGQGLQHGRVLSPGAAPGRTSGGGSGSDAGSVNRARGDSSGATQPVAQSGSPRVSGNIVAQRSFQGSAAASGPVASDRASSRSSSTGGAAPAVPTAAVSSSSSSRSRRRQSVADLFALDSEEGMEDEPTTVLARTEDETPTADDQDLTQVDPPRFGEVESWRPGSLGRKR